MVFLVRLVFNSVSFYVNMKLIWIKKSSFQTMVPFESIFEVSYMKKYVKVIRMVSFTRDVMPNIWPAEHRTGRCLDETIG